MKRTLEFFNFTKNEIKIIIFVLSVLIAGFGIKYFNYIFAKTSNSKYDYSKTDQDFLNYSKKLVLITTKDSLSQNDSTKNETISKLDSNKTNPINKKNKKEEKLKEKGININTATKEIFVLLPGVGESTAEKIIKYRNDHNGFRKIEDIMKVKGIGKKKFEKMKPYITIE